MMGFGLPDDNIHAPNEKMSVRNYEGGIESMIGYFDLAGS
jgi:acetylornithine deacetylase/succinyl-diaminopimelate desuccinylase-like protein